MRLLDRPELLERVEFKYANAPAVTKSLRVAREDLRLRRAFLRSLAGPLRGAGRPGPAKATPRRT